MEIRKGRPTDLDDIEKIYERIHDNEEKGLSTTGWIRRVYPTGKTAEDALGRGDLFVMTDHGRTVAVAVINHIQVPEYRNVTWRYEAKDAEILVLHGLAVDPQEKGKGYGRSFVSFYEEEARRQGCVALRMDTHVRNTRARKLYRSLGYEEIGTVPCNFNGIPDVELVCLEKGLT